LDPPPRLHTSCPAGYAGEVPPRRSMRDYRSSPRRLVLSRVLLTSYPAQALPTTNPVRVEVRCPFRPGAPREASALPPCGRRVSTLPKYNRPGLVPGDETAALGCRFSFTPAALLGFALRSFLLPKGNRRFTSGWTRLPFLLSVLPPPKRWAGPTGRGFRALTLPRVPGGRVVISKPSRWMLPWDLPF
jgi:hypothetical protein